MLFYFVHNFRYFVEMMLIFSSGDFISQFGLNLCTYGVYFALHCKLGISVLIMQVVRALIFNFTLYRYYTYIMANISY